MKGFIICSAFFLMRYILYVPIVVKTLYFYHGLQLLKGPKSLYYQIDVKLKCL